MFDLDLSLLPRRTTPPAVLGVRELTGVDLLPGEGKKAGSDPKPVRELRDSHRELARLLARGVRGVDASALTGYSQSRISILQNDPAFKELLAHYRTEQECAFADLAERTKLMTLDALTELHERIVENPGQVGTGVLLDIVKTGLDRSGVGPQSTTKNLHVHVDPSTVAALKAAAEEQGRVINANITYEGSSGSSLASDPSGELEAPGLNLRLPASAGAEERVGVSAAPVAAEAKAATREQGEGEGV